MVVNRVRIDRLIHAGSKKFLVTDMQNPLESISRFDLYKKC